MRRLIAFESVTIDGYFSDVNGDVSWAHSDDAEWNAFVADNAKGGGQLLFGRTTYELMAGYWPTPAALENNPAVAERMNNLPKVVFSRTLKQATWSNTKLVTGDLATEVRRMKSEPGEDIAILGSGSVVSQLAQEGLVDELQIALHPVVLGKGRTMFDGVTEALRLKLISTRAFNNGNVVLCYGPTAQQQHTRGRGGSVSGFWRGCARGSPPAFGQVLSDRERRAFRVDRPLAWRKTNAPDR